MKTMNPTRFLLLTCIVVMIGVLIVGCAKKPEPIVDTGPTAEELEQARLDSIASAEALVAAERAAADKAAMEAAEAARLEAEQNAKSSLQVVYFDLDRSNLNTDGRQAAEFDAGVLQQYTGWNILIEGHCDERGSDEYNLALGERRANTLKEFFVNYGIDAARISTVSYGEERPADPAHNNDAWDKNRRAVLVIR